MASQPTVTVAVPVPLTNEPCIWKVVAPMLNACITTRVGPPVPFAVRSTAVGVVPSPCVTVFTALVWEAVKATEFDPKATWTLAALASWRKFWMVAVARSPRATVPFVMFWVVIGNWAASAVRFLPVSSSVPGG